MVLDSPREHAVLTHRPRKADRADRAGILPLLLALSASFILANAAPQESHAAWPHSPVTNLRVCTVGNSQENQTIVSDGAGGAIITWNDVRSGNYDIYAQHVLGVNVDAATAVVVPGDDRAACAIRDDCGALLAGARRADRQVREWAVRPGGM